MFQAAFPYEKRVEVLIFGQEKILSYITEIILYKTPETLSKFLFNFIEEKMFKSFRARIVHMFRMIIGIIKN